MRDFGTRAGHLGGDAVQRPVADQVADVRRDPVGAGLDELVVVELVEVFLQDAELLAEHAEQRSQRAGHGALPELVEHVLLECGQYLAGIDLGLQLDIDLAVVGIEPAGRDRRRCLVAHAQDGGEQLVQLLHIDAHVIAPSDSCVASSVSNSAALTLPSLCTAGKAATRRGCGCGAIGPVSMR